MQADVFNYAEAQQRKNGEREEQTVHFCSKQLFILALNEKGPNQDFTENWFAWVAPPTPRPSINRIRITFRSAHEIKVCI
jgi:hypothetical protein